MAQPVISARCGTTSEAMADRPRHGIRSLRWRVWPVSISTTTLMPARKSGSPGWRSSLHPQRNALHHLHPVPRGVLRRQDGELRAAARRDALHRALPDPAGIGIDADPRRIARLDIGQVGFLRVRLDPDMVGGDQAEGGDRGGQIGAGLDLIDLGGDGIERRAHGGVVELALRLLHLGLRLQVFGGAGDIHVGIAAESRQLHLRLHLQALHRRLVGGEPEPGVVVFGPGDARRPSPDWRSARSWPGRTAPAPAWPRCRAACADSRAWPPPSAAPTWARLASAPSSAIWNGRGSSRNSTSPRRTWSPSLTATSWTMPDTSVATASLPART